MQKAQISQAAVKKTRKNEKKTFKTLFLSFFLKNCNVFFVYAVVDLAFSRGWEQINKKLKKTFSTTQGGTKLNFHGPQNTINKTLLVKIVHRRRIF